MAIVGTAEVTITANTAAFEKQLQSQVQKAADKVAPKISPKVDTGKSGNLIKSFTDLTDKAEASLAQFGLTTRDVSVLLGAGLAGGVAFAARSIVAFGADVVQTAAALGEQLNQSKVIFGDFAEDVEGFAKNAATSFGQSETQALAAASQFGTIAKAAGLGQQAAAQFSIALTQLAGDLSSFKDISPEEALQRLQSGLVGETESLRRLGVIVDEDTKKRAAQREGLTKGNEELTAQQKILATYSEILRQTTDAQGDFARTSDSLPNQLRAASAQVTNLKAQLGTGLLPVVTKEVGAFSDLLFIAEKATGALKRVSVVFGQKDSGKSFIERAVDAAVPAIPALESLANALGKDKATTIEAKSAADLLALSLGDVSDKSSGAAVALSVVSQAAQDAAQLFVQASAGFTKRLESFTPKFGEDFRDEATKTAGAAKKASDAAERLRRANEDADHSISESKIKLARTVREANEDIADADKKLAEVERNTAREIRDDQERIADARRELARTEHEIQEQRIEDARAAQDAVTQAQRDFVSAVADLNAETENLTPEQKRARQLEALRKRAVEEEQAGFRRLAQIHADANKDREDEADKERDIARLERDLAEDRADSAREIADAKLDLARTTRDANERIEDSQRDLARTEVEAARSIADAQKAIGEATAASAKKAELSVKSLLKSFQTNASDLESFNNSLDSIGKRLKNFAVETTETADREIKQAFLAQLAQLGPGAAPFLRELANTSDKELKGVVDAFDRQIKAAKQAADDNFDLFPENFAEKIEATRHAAENKLNDLVADFDDASKQGGKALDAVGDHALTLALTLDQAVNQGILALDRQETKFLELALSAKTPQERIDALKDLLHSLESKHIKVTADTSQAQAAVEALTGKAKELFDIFNAPLTGPSSLGAGDGGNLADIILNPNLRQSGGPVTSGDPFIVGERGAELFIPNRNGEIISNDVLERLIRALESGMARPTESVGPVTIVSQATDARVLANELAFRFGRDSQR